MPTSLSGQLDLGSATEGTALASNTDVASFTVNNTTDDATAFTATIQWGDGTTTTGTIVGSNGSFTVEGGHTYADEGFPSATVTVTRPADNSQLVLNGTIAVDDADNLAGHSAAAITAQPNQALTNVTVATFTDTYTGHTASDFTTSIDWGDGTTTPGVLSGSGANYTVTGSHTYATAGQFTITTFMNDGPDGAVGVATTTAGIGFGGNGVPFEVNENTATGTITVANFSDNAGLTASDYTATIDWGDGTSSIGTVSTSGGGAFSVAGSHTYADEGNFTATTTVLRSTDSTQIQMPAAATVDDDDLLHASGTTIHGDTVLSNVTVATFTDTDHVTDASDFIATINWGDGSTSAGTVSGSNGAFSISGSHTYAQGGQYSVSADVKDDGAGLGEDTAQSTASVGLHDGAGTSFTQAEGAAGAPQTATFTDGDTADTASDFTATIDWGDGTASVGTVSGANGTFAVSGSHTYADEGSFTATTTVVRNADATVLTATATATVTESDSFVVTSGNLSGNPGQAFSNVQVAAFTDTYLGQVAGDLAAVINWGDGTSSAGTIAGSNGNFTVTASHTYTSGGVFNVATTVSDDAPGTATATGTGTATVNLPGTMTLTSATEHVATGNVTVATFSDSNGADQASDFTATINWADGTTSAGSVSGGGGTFSVQGNHTYPDEGSFQAAVTLTRTTDGSASTTSGAVSVAEHDSLTGHGAAISGSAHHALSNVTVATFTDTDTVTPASDFVATINWGDGTTSAGTVSGASGAFTVSGSHTYAAVGHDTVTVTMSDDAPGTATATATSTATIGSGAGNLNDFNADQISDVLWHFSGGSVSEWLMQGGAIASNLGVGSDSGLHFLDTGDFNADGHSDILWRDDSGNVSLWTMNSAQILGKQTIGNVSSDWQNQGVADFNGDGHADVLWRDGGAVSLWTTNGAQVTANQSVASNLGVEWHIQGLGDFNGDGNSDVLLRNAASGQLVLWTMNGAQITANQSITNLGLDWHVLGTGDFNGDGHADILLRNDDSQVVLLTMNGNQIVANQNVNTIDASWHLQGIGDYTGDGHADVLWRNDSGQVALWEMNGNQITSDHQVNYASGATNTTDNSWTVLHHQFDLV